MTTDVNNDFPIYGRNLNLIVDNPSDNQVYSPSNTNPDVRAMGRRLMSAPMTGCIKYMRSYTGALTKLI